MSSLTTWVCLSAAFSQLIHAYAPAPIAVPVGTQWYGDDGNWSPVNIRIGAQPNPQWLSVFPNTAGQEVWVIGPGGCDGTFTCQQKRGGLFFLNQSTSWSDLGYYELGFDPQLGDSGDADYGLDLVDLSDQITVPNQIIAIINSTDYWLGSLGLGVRPSRFNGTTNQLTFLSSLVENQSIIPSHSYGYTAGAYYRLKNVPASLTFGGVDTNRFVPNSASFTLDPGLQPVVAVNSITVSSNLVSGSSGSLHWTSNPLTLLSKAQADLFTIDSSTSFLWLPEEVCNSFASAFNLVYNESLQLYFYDDNGTTLDTINNVNVTFSFSISDFPGSSNSVDLSLPYAAFDLQLSFPYPGIGGDVATEPINYFPLRKAANNTQYTIGRSFLQEVYLTVDYERNNFSLSQATFALDSLTNINLEAITRPKNSNFTGPAGTSSDSGLPMGAEVGIGVGAGVLVLGIIGILVFCCISRRRRNSKKISSQSDADSFSNQDHPRPAELFGDVKHTNEVPGDRRPPTEVASDATTSRFEMPGSIPFEMAADDVPDQYLSSNRNNSYEMTSRNSQNRAELDTPVSDTKSSHGLPDQQRVSGATLPVYKLARHNDSVSPHSPTRSSGGFGNNTHSSGEQGISPVTTTHRPSAFSHDIMSPVSPSATGFPPQHAISHYKLRGAEPRSGSPSALVVAQDHLLARSLSRGSRFVEDLPDESVKRASQSEDHSRFSWER